MKGIRYLIVLIIVAITSCRDSRTYYKVSRVDNSSVKFVVLGNTFRFYKIGDTVWCVTGIGRPTIINKTNDIPIPHHIKVKLLEEIKP